MSTPERFPLRPFPHRLRRSLVTFAFAGTVMAAVTLADSTVPRAVPALLLLAGWGIPAAFAWQVRRHGFDPLEALTLTEDGLLATYHDGHRRLLPWAGMARLVVVLAPRQRSWLVTHEDAPPLRWFGELEDEDGFAARLAERSRLAWEVLPAEPAELGDRDASGSAG